MGVRLMGTTLELEPPLQGADFVIQAEPPTAAEIKHVLARFQIAGIAGLETFLAGKVGLKLRREPDGLAISYYEGTDIVIWRMSRLPCDVTP